MASTISTLSLTPRAQHLAPPIMQNPIAGDQNLTIPTLRTPMVGDQILTSSSIITTKSKDRMHTASTISTPTDLLSLNALASEITEQAFALTTMETDLTARAKLVAAAEKIIISARSPGENAYYTGAQVYTNGIISTAYQLQCFDNIPPDSVGVAASELAEKAGTDEALIVRIMRALSTLHIFIETGPSLYRHSQLSLTFRNPQTRAYFWCQTNLFGAAIAKLPDLLSDYNNSLSPSPDMGLWQYSLNTELDQFGYYAQHPDILARFNEAMRAPAFGGSSILPPFPFETLSCASEDETMLVDVGGGKGQILEAILGAFPASALTGRMILQETPGVLADAEQSGALAKAISAGKLSLMGVDFFNEQPVKGARAYLLRRVLHDWSDAQCKVILGHIKASMGPESRILVVDMVLSDMGASKRECLSDLTMMSFGGIERSHGQWVELLGSVGLVIKNIWGGETDLKVIEVIQKDQAES